MKTLALHFLGTLAATSALLFVLAVSQHRAAPTFVSDFGGVIEAIGFAIIPCVVVYAFSFRQRSERAWWAQTGLAAALALLLVVAGR